MTNKPRLSRPLNIIIASMGGASLCYPCLIDQPTGMSVFIYFWNFFDIHIHIYYLITFKTVAGNLGTIFNCML